MFLGMLIKRLKWPVSLLVSILVGALKGVLSIRQLDFVIIFDLLISETN
jgi:hypothetical protein